MRSVRGGGPTALPPEWDRWASLYSAKWLRRVSQSGHVRDRLAVGDLPGHHAQHLADAQQPVAVSHRRNGDQCGGLAAQSLGGIAW